MRANLHLLFVVAASVAAGCGAGGPPIVSPAMVKSAQSRSPEATQASLEAGRETYGTACKKCHALPKINKYSAEKWPGYVESMSKAAKLDETQTKQVMDYVLAARASAP